MFVYITTSAKKEEKPEDGADKISLQIWKTGYLDVTKTFAPHITHLMCSLVLLLTISFQLLASFNRCLPSFSYICSLTETMSRKFQEVSRIWQE